MIAMVQEQKAKAFRPVEQVRGGKISRLDKRAALTLVYSSHMLITDLKMLAQSGFKLSQSDCARLNSLY